MSLRSIILGVAALCCAAVPALGAVQNTTQGTSFPTIQAAIDGASDGDVLEADPGLYVEQVDFHKKAVTLRSASGNPADTTIDGAGVGPVVKGTVSKVAFASISGFTIQNGTATLGGAIDAGNGHTNVSNCVIRGSTANAGGGMYIPCGSPTISDCVFANNEAGNGGALFVWGAAPALINCVFLGNVADVGGAIHLLTGGTSLINCALTGNTATQMGGAMCVQGGATTITNCTMFGNTAGAGGALHLTSSYAMTVANTILWGNAPDQVLDASGFPVISYCDIEGGFPAGAIDAGGNVYADPLFADADGADNIPGTPDDDLRLSPGSPCIDAGDNGAPALAGVTTDLLGHPRFIDDPGTPDSGAGTPPIVDMGAIEFGMVIPPDPVRNVTQGTGYATIQGAINAANGGDVIEVDPGTYNEHLNLLGKAMTLQSASGDPSNTIIDGTNASTVVMCTSLETAATVIRGFTIANGAASDGGGAFCFSSSPTFDHCIFMHNHAFNMGGAIYSTGTSSPTISACMFLENGASEGGAIANLGSSPTIAGCNFVMNMASSGFGGGGAIYNNNASPVIGTSTFKQNAAMSHGGAVLCQGMSNVRISNSHFLGNTGMGKGAGIRAQGSRLSLFQCVFSGNMSFGFGSQGGALYVQGDRCDVTNCAFSDNMSNIGGAIYSSGALLNVRNGVLWGNTPDQISDEFGFQATLAYSAIEGGIPFNVLDGGGNVSSDPLFTNPAGPDGAPGTSDDDLRPLPGSPCIDAGDNSAPDLAGVSSDLDANPRFVDDFGAPDTGVGPAPIVDMGPYEFQAGPAPDRVYNITNGTAFPTIQSAINAAGNGDVLVADTGVYFEHIDFLGKAITLRGDSPNAVDTIIDGSHTGTVVTCQSLEGPQTRLEGFTIQNGSAANGGGMANVNGSPTVFNCRFVANFASAGGGGMWNNTGSFPNVSASTFIANMSNMGAGMYNRGADASIDACLFEANVAMVPDGGGGMHNVDSNIVITGSEFHANSAESGSGMACANSTLLIRNCRFYGNTGMREGAGIASQNSDLNLVNCEFSGNTLFSGFSQGAGISCMAGMTHLTNCSFTENVAGLAGAIFNNFTMFEITNCVLWGNQPTQFQGNGGFFTHISYSDIQGGFPPGAMDFGGNIFDDPFFADADGPDNSPGTQDDDLSLLAGSPCIDAGNSGVPELIGVPADLAGNVRIVDDIGKPDTGVGGPPVVDMGAYEFQGVSPITCACAGDLDGDCDTDFLDFGIFATNFRTAVPRRTRGDLNDNGLVDIADFALLAADFGCRD